MTSKTRQSLSGDKKFKHDGAPPSKPEHAGHSFGDIAPDRHLDQRIDEVIGKLHNPSTADLTRFSDELLVAWVHESALEQLRCDLEALAKRTVDQCSPIVEHLTELYKVCQVLEAAQRATSSENATLTEQLKGLNEQLSQLDQQVNGADKHAMQRSK